MGKKKGFSGMFRDAMQEAVQRKYDHYPEKKAPKKKAHGIAMRIGNSLGENTSNDPAHFFRKHFEQEIDLYVGGVKECPLTRIEAEQTVAGNLLDDIRQQVVDAVHQKYREPDQPVHHDRTPWWKRLFKL